MAITIGQNPLATRVGGRGYYGMGPCWWRCTSSSTAQPNFKYLVQIYDGATEVQKFVVSPNQTGTLLFNMEEISQQYVKPDYYIGSLGLSLHYLCTVGGAQARPFTTNVDGCKMLQIRFGEKYDVAGVPTEFPGTTLGTDMFNQYFFGYRYQYADGLNPTGLNKWSLGSVSGLNLPLTRWQAGAFKHEDSSAWGIEGQVQIPVRIADYGVMAFPHDALTIDAYNETVTVEYTLYNGASTVGTDSVTINAANGAAAGTSTTDTDKLIYFGAYPKNLSQLLTTIDPSLWPDALNTWTHYRLRWKASGASFSLATYFVLDNVDDCRYDNIRLGFANDKGGWDYFNFGKKNEISWKVEPKKFNKLMGDLSVINYTQFGFERSETTFAQTIEKMYVLTSDWITEEAFEVLKQIYLSRDVHILDEANLTHIPVTVMETTYQQRRIRSANLYNITLNVKLAQPYIS